MKIRIEISSLASVNKSGVGYYTQLFAEALAANHEITTYGHYFDFLKRQPAPTITGSIISERSTLIPLRAYAKLQSYNIAPPFDTFLPKVDLTIFPNFAAWPSVKTTLRAATIHDLTYIHFPELIETKNLPHMQRVVPRSIREADLILTVSESVKKELMAEFGLDEKKCVVTPIPPDTSFKQRCSIQRLRLVRDKYAIGSKKYILFLGNFEPRKNLETLIQAYGLLPNKYREEYRLVLAGGRGWKSERAQRALDNAAAAGMDITHIGYVDDADRPALYQAASLFVMPSLYEGFGMPVLEAMESGCPVVAADIAALREAGGQAALYTNPKSPERMAGTVVKALQNYPFSRKQMSENVKRFSWESNVQLLVDTVNQLRSNSQTQ